MNRTQSRNTPRQSFPKKCPNRLFIFIPGCQLRSLQFFATGIRINNRSTQTQRNRPTFTSAFSPNKNSENPGKYSQKIPTTVRQHRQSTTEVRTTHTTAQKPIQLLDKCLARNRLTPVRCIPRLPPDRLSHSSRRRRGLAGVDRRPSTAMTSPNAVEAAAVSGWQSLILPIPVSK